jgi:hypothetical protein
MNWLTPAEVDGERWRWRRWKGQRGGWDTPLWLVLQELWRKSL